MRFRSPSCCSTAPASPPDLFSTSGVRPRCAEPAGSDPVARGLTPLEALRRRGRYERVADDAEDLLARSFDHGDEAAELQSRELDAALPPDGHEPEVGEEVAREDRLVHLEALEGRAGVAVVVCERLERPSTLLARVADRRQEERLHHPRLRRID